MAVQIFHNYPLTAHNTFGLPAPARRFATVRTAGELQQLLAQEPPPYFVLGGGSNILLSRPLEALVIHNAISEKSILAEAEDYALVAAGGGENWHDFVSFCLDEDLGGLENLSLIPGTVGAAPIQNIGAYGVELQEVFDHLEAIELATGEKRRFEAGDCRFGYRNSIFKQELKGQYCITRVIFRLTRRRHRLRIDYGALRNTLAEMGASSPGIRQVSEAVIRIRRAKLPDPARLGNAGSFFKNPEIEKEVLTRLQTRFPEIVHYPLPNGRVKVPAGWLIEQCGWKGKRIGAVGAYDKQALVLVNYGGATGKELLGLARAIQDSVWEKFGIELETEVNII